jgi:hypothetical protein
MSVLVQQYTRKWRRLARLGMTARNTTPSPAVTPSGSCPGKDQVMSQH